jgi:hypothetical protein
LTAIAGFQDLFSEQRIVPPSSALGRPGDRMSARTETMETIASSTDAGLSGGDDGACLPKGPHNR